MAEDHAVEQVLSDIANGMGRKLDEHSRQLTIQGQQIAEVSRKLDEQELTLYDHTAILRQHSRDIREMRADLHTINGKMDQVIELLKKPGE